MRLENTPQTRLQNLVIEALEEAGYELSDDGRFVEDLGDTSHLTIAFNLNTDDIQIAKGDWRGYYWNNYDFAILLWEGADLDEIFDNLEIS